MVELAFAVNAAMALLGLGLCLSHAWGDRDRLTFLGTGVVYGVLLEQLVILRFEAYHYNADDFLLTVADVPLVIGFGWAAIIYSGFELARRFDVSARVTPLFVALFALHIDLAIDAVAIRVPFWTWTPPGAWFGVPLGNFLGWFLVAALFTAAWLALEGRMSLRPVRGLATIVLAVAGLVAVLEVWTSVATTLPRKVAILGGIVLVSLVLVARDRPTTASVDPRVAAVPFLYHGFYLGLLLVLGIYRDIPALLVVSLAMLAVSALLHANGAMSRRLPGRASG